jgi:DNA repair exonuclease SbcCD nuclease subunit
VKFRFVHAADLHLDTPFEGIRDAARSVNRALCEASLDAFDSLVDLCIESEAAFLAVAGDVYDGAERGLRAQLRFLKGLERLSRAGVQVFVVHGNHDPSEEGWSAIRDWSVTVFGHERVEAQPVVRDGVKLATLYGISYPRRDVGENLSLAFPRRTGADVSDGSGLKVGLLHCNVGGNTEHAPYAACSLADLAAADIDYWALGHVHTRKTLSDGSRPDEPWVVYPGNLQGRSPRASEQGAKGALVVSAEIGPDGPVVRGVEFHALDRVRFVAVSLDVSESSDLGEVERALQARADELREEHPDRGLILCADIHGRSVVQHDLARPRSRDDLLESLRDGCAGEQPFTWWGSLSCDVRLPIDRQGLRERDDFCADLLALADELAERPDDLQRFAREALADLPDDLNGVAIPQPAGDGRHGVDRDGVAGLVALLRQAEQVALESLGVESGGEPSVGSSGQAGAESGGEPGATGTGAGS